MTQCPKSIKNMALKKICITNITIEQKLKIIEEMESYKDQNFAEMARKHGFSRYIISRLCKTRVVTLDRK